MKISLIINTYNRLNSLPNTLEAIESLRYRELEVIVVDGPSKDGTYEYLKQHWSDKVKLCSCPEANLSKSRNIGILNAMGEVVCFIDDDGVPEPDWLDQLMPAYADPAVAAAGGWVRDHTGVDFQTKYITSRRDSTSETKIENPESMPACTPHADPFPGLIGVNSSFRKSSLLEVGGFDEEYAYFLDETDVLARLVDAGHSVVILPNAEVHHKYAASHIRHDSGAAKSWYQIIRSTAYFILKNAAPDTALTDLLKEIARHKEKLTTHTAWFLANGMIDRSRHQRLLAEIESGADNGIRDAFKYPLRQLLIQQSLTKWWPFPRPLSSGDRIRVAFVTRQYPPAPCGGVAIFIHHLARALASMGHEVTVITQAEGGRRHTVDFEERVWVHRLPEYDSVKMTLPESMPDMPGELASIAGRVLAELDRVNERRQFDCVVGAIWDLDLAAVIASQRYPVAMYLVTSYKLMEESKPEWRSNKHFFENHVKKMFEAEKWAVLTADRIIASTQAIRRDTEAAYDLSIDDSRLSILPFGVPRPADSVEGEIPASDDVRLLFVGRLEPRKGIDDLLGVLPELMVELPDLTVTCIGDKSLLTPEGGTYSEKFLQKHRSAPWLNRVHFPGHVAPDVLDRSYATCDVFVAPSRYESFGLIYLEAMRYGKPCIGTDAGGIPEVVIHNETGLLVPPGDGPALRDAIRELVLNRNLRIELGDNGRRRFEEGFTTEIFARNFESYLRGWVHGTAGAQDPAVPEGPDVQSREAEATETNGYKTA